MAKYNWFFVILLLLGLTTSSFLQYSSNSEKIFFNSIGNNETSYDIGFSTYLGGSAIDNIVKIKISSTGTIFVIGQTISDNFNVTGSYINNTRIDDGNEYDLFLSQFDQEGNLTWSSYFGSSKEDMITDITFDNQDNWIVVGSTWGNDFPAIGDHANLTRNNMNDGFVTKFNSNNQIVWSTYLGGGSRDKINGVATDTQGNIWVVGQTDSDDFLITTNVTIHAYDAFITKYSPEGEILFSKVFGTDAFDVFNAINIVNDELYVLGTTDGDSFMGKSNPHNGSMEAIITKFNSTGSPEFVNFFGGEGDEEPYDLAVDNQNNTFIVGYTESENITMSGTYSDTTRSGQEDGFIAKFNSTGDVILSTYFGGNSSDTVSSITIYNDYIYIGGYTDSLDFNVTSYGEYTEPTNKNNGFISILSEDGEIVYGTYWGGQDAEMTSISVVDGNIYTAGGASGNLTTYGKYADTSPSSDDGFITKLVDSFAPVVTIMPIEDTEYNHTILSYEIDDINPFTTTIYLDNIKNTSIMQSGYNITDLIAGVHNITVTAEDLAGNIGIKTEIFTVSAISDTNTSGTDDSNASNNTDTSTSNNTDSNTSNITDSFNNTDNSTSEIPPNNNNTIIIVILVLLGLITISVILWIKIKRNKSV